MVHDFENEKSFAQREQLAYGTLQKAGYYTVDFDTKVSLKKGERYAVLVYLKTPGTKHPMAIEDVYKRQVRDDRDGRTTGVSVVDQRHGRVAKSGRDKR